MIKQLYIKASELEAEQHAAAEKDKVGTLRGGTTGALTDKGEVVGQCHRKAMVRFLGLQKRDKGGGSAYFDMGIANELLVKLKLDKSWPGLIKCEEEIPMAWDLEGTPVTGRPDMILGHYSNLPEGAKITKGVDGIEVVEGRPELSVTTNGLRVTHIGGEELKFVPEVGVELKSVGAINSAAGLFFDKKPKLANLLQAAHYSSQFKIPFYLVYNSFVGGALPYWAQKQYGAKKVDPFMMEFKVYITEKGVICYDTEDGKQHITHLTVDSIKNFYRLVVDMVAKKTLYKRFTDRDVNNNPLPYSPCDYCPLQGACMNYEDDFDRWLDQITKLKLEGE